jgi:hypothetical protein
LIKSWEINLRTGTTPLESFYEAWKKSTQKKLKRQNVDVLEDADHDYDNLPKIKAPAAKKAKLDGPPVLFPSDDEDEPEINFDAGSDSEDDEVQQRPAKNGKAKKNQKELKKKPEKVQEESGSEEADESFFDNGDIVEDTNANDW